MPPDEGEVARLEALRAGMAEVKVPEEKVPKGNDSGRGRKAKGH